MLAVVDLHGARVDVRLERVEGVGQFGQFVHGWFLLAGSILRGSYLGSQVNAGHGCFWTRGFECV